MGTRTVEDAHAVVMDVVRSRELAQLGEAMAHAGRVATTELVERGHATSAAQTVGDELQAAYVGVAPARVVADVARLRLALRASVRDGAPSVELRFGIGAGVLVGDPADAAAPAQSGTAWWRARAAIEVAASRRNGWPDQRWWYDAATPSATLHATLILVDTLLPGMDADDCWAATSLLDGMAASDVAHGLQRSASAMSRRLHGRGVYGLVRALEQLEGADRG
ncbi:MAG: hypothetical protein ACI970_001118 [Myxococcota bacterium]|jgi:hypothetical protein